MTAPEQPRSELGTAGEAKLDAHVREFARLCSLPGADGSLLAKAAEEGAENLRKQLGAASD